jgi:hypothetical protein
MLIKKFGLLQRGFSKYCYGIDFCMSSAGSIRYSAFV